MILFKKITLSIKVTLFLKMINIVFIVVEVQSVSSMLLTYTFRYGTPHCIVNSLSYI